MAILAGRLGGRRGGSKAAAWDGVDYLDLVPARQVDFEDAGGEANVVLLVPRYRDWFWGRVLQPRLGPRKRYVRVPLEARGTALWRAMDGRATVRELLPAAAAVEASRGSLEIGDGDFARRVCMYLQALVENGFVALVMHEGPALRDVRNGLNE